MDRKISRRQFIKGTAIAGGALMMPALGPFVRSAQAYAVSPPLRKFIDPMPLFGADIPLASRTASQPYAGVDYYQLTAGMFRQRLHSSLPSGGTKLYGYADHTGNYKHLGGAVVATRDRAVRYSFRSELPSSHILPYDSSIPSPGNGGNRQDRAAVHLHGGLVPWPSDGGPFHWQCPDPSVVGASVIPWLWNGSTNVWDYYYPNHQSARMMWYHDHALGQTRLNAYAGLATGYIVQDGDDNLSNGVLQNAYGIPFLGQPIVFQDKVFWNDVNDPLYPGFVPNAEIGDLWYPWFYDPAIWPVAKGGNPPSPSAVPEFFGDTMLANGHVYPFHEVGAGRHRFRFLNACNARWLDLSFVQEDPARPGEPLLDRKGVPVAAPVDVWQIGTEGGFLPAPVRMVTNGVPNQPFLLGPAERADLIVDFKGSNGSRIILYNVAGSPFPGGSPIFDWYVGNRNLPVAPTPGFGPNTRTIMQFRVVGVSQNSISIPPTLPGVTIPTIPARDGGLQVDTAALASRFPGFAYDPVPVDLSLNEVVEPAGFAGGNTGRLLTLIGNRATPVGVPFGANGIYYTEPPTEAVTYNTVRIWRIFNFTADAHPMHFHLFNVQVLARQKANKNFGITGHAVPPLPNEMGLKETVTVYPGQVTIVAALVEDPLPAGEYPRVTDPATGLSRPAIPVTVGGTTVNSMVPVSPRLSQAPYNLQVDEYVWHCHILEHEEHDMMRPLVATGNGD